MSYDLIFFFEELFLKNVLEMFLFKIILNSLIY